MPSRSEKMMKETIICESCGAEFEASLVRCPYCGTGYAPQEETEYMEKLEGIREDLAEQKEKGDRQLRKGMSGTIRIVLIAIIVLLLLLFGGLWLSDRAEKRHDAQRKEEFLQKEGITTQQEETTDAM